MAENPPDMSGELCCPVTALILKSPLSESSNLIMQTQKLHVIYESFHLGYLLTNQKCISGQGGTIFFGIGKDRKVFGLEMNRDEKDQFRLGIDQLMHRKIIPILLHSQFDVITEPVLDPDTHCILKDLYVIGKLCSILKVPFKIVTVNFFIILIYQGPVD